MGLKFHDGGARWPLWISNLILTGKINATYNGFDFFFSQKTEDEHGTFCLLASTCVMSCSHRWIYGVGWAMSTVTKHPKLIAIGLYWFLHTIKSAYHILYLNFWPPNPITCHRWLRNKSPNSAHWALEVLWARHRVKSRVHAILSVSIDRIMFIKTIFTSWMDHSNPMILDFISDSFFWQCTRAHKWLFLCHLTPTL